LGLAYVEALTRAGLQCLTGAPFLGYLPLSQEAGTRNANIKLRTVFVKCDVSSWDDQVNLFRVAKEKAPNGRIDAVIANAGIYGPDILEGAVSRPLIVASRLSEEQPTKPNTSMLNVNLIGVMYTTRLAAWHFDRQNSIDPCVILVSSIMGYIDTQGSSVYSAAKHGVRGLMTCLRRKKTIRVNCLAPW
ncbi:hypothetical protein ANOM_005460, partial [Aspergillus nomiae NRRL 13137]